MVRGWLPYLGCALDFGRDPPGFLLRCQQQHGSAFTVHLLGRRVTFLLDPRDFPQVLKSPEALAFDPITRDISTKTFGYRSIFEAGITEDQLRGAYTRHLRPQVVGPLAQRTQQELAKQFAREVQALPRGDDGWCEVELLDFVGRCIFFAGVTAMFGEGIADRLLYDRFLHYDRQFPRLVAGIPIRAMRSTHRAREGIVERLRYPWPNASAFIDDRRELLDAHVDDIEAARVHLSMLWAAQANTIPATFWALALLLHTPDALEAVREEIDGAVTRDAEGHPRVDADTRKRLPRTDSAIVETLRLSSGSASIRRVLAPVTLELADGRSLRLRPGDDVSVYPYIGHRDPEIFDDPTAYRYDRFVSERGAKQFFKQGQRLGFPVMPFGGGESMCPGRFLAQSEIRTFLALALADYEVQLRPGQALPGFDLARSGLGILPPDGPCHARLRRRSTR